MEKWAMEKSKNVNWDNKESKKKGCFGGLLYELGDGFKGLLDNGMCRKRNRAMVFECNHAEDSGSDFYRCRKRFRESSHGDDEEEVSEDSVGLDLSSEKAETLQGILKWLTFVAISHQDSSIGVIPHYSKWKEYTENQCWNQVIRAKNALLIQRDNTELRYQNSPLLGNQTIHPSMFEDDHKSSRCSIRRKHLSKPDSCNGSLVSLGSNNCRELITTELVTGSSGATKPEIPRRYVSVGRNSQARVDEWTVTSLDSETKWLGTRIWPLENDVDKLGNDLIGKGRLDCCSCNNTNLSGSVECIRFHIAEKRMELKRELGDVFFRWRFNQMGEEVSLKWTEREEKRFKEMMMEDSQSFWENAGKSFRVKKREEVVSYYYNVLLINRRRYQNRVNPRCIDSDDEGAFGSVGNGFGRDAISIFGSDIMICSQNSQCYEFD